MNGTIQSVGSDEILSFRNIRSKKMYVYESIFVVLAVLTFLSPQADGNLMHYETWIIMKLTGFRLKVQTKYKSGLIEICGLDS